MAWPTDDLLTDALDSLADNPVDSLPQIYNAVLKLQEILAELTAGDTVLSAENAASNGIARTDADNQFSTRQTINVGSSNPLLLNTTDVDWINVIDFTRGGDVARGFRLAHDDTSNYWQLSVANQSAIRVDHGSAQLRLVGNDITYNGASLVNNSKPAAAYDDDTFTGITGSYKQGATVAWTQQADYNRVLVTATVQTQGNNDVSYSCTVSVQRDSTSYKTQRFWTAEDQEGTITVQFLTTNTGAGNWNVKVLCDESPSGGLGSISCRTSITVQSINAL